MRLRLAVAFGLAVHELVTVDSLAERVAAVVARPGRDRAAATGSIDDEPARHALALVSERRLAP